MICPKCNFDLPEKFFQNGLCFGCHMDAAVDAQIEQERINDMYEAAELSVYKYSAKKQKKLEELV
jgi:hypothetical protein